MNGFVIHDVADQAAIRRWGASGMAIMAAHVAATVLFMSWTAQRPAPGSQLPVIMVNMAPVMSSPQPTPMDLAPGPVMQQADASPPPESAQQQTVTEPVAPTPPQPAPVVEAPPESKPHPALATSEPAKIVQKQKPTAVKPAMIRAKAKKPTPAPPAPRTTADPGAEHQGAAASAVSAGVTAAIVASYKQSVAAHLQRFKQYPPVAKAAGQQGVARISFTLGRGGQVMSSGLGGSSGQPGLDAETLAMVRRAQPFPSFPPELKQATMSFSAPVAFQIR